MIVPAKQAAREIPFTLQTVEGASVEGQMFRDSNNDLVIITKFGMTCVLDGLSALSVARKILEVLEQ